MTKRERPRSTTPEVPTRLTAVDTQLQLMDFELASKHAPLDRLETTRLAVEARCAAAATDDRALDVFLLLSLVNKFEQKENVVLRDVNAMERAMQCLLKAALRAKTDHPCPVSPTP